MPGSLTREVVDAVGTITRPTTGKECMDLLTLAGMLMSAAVPWTCWLYRGLSEDEEDRVFEAMEIVRDLVNEMDERGEWKHEW